MPKLRAAVSLVLLLSACGQTGPLYLPDKTPPKKHKSAPAQVTPVGPPPEAPEPARPDAASGAAASPPATPAPRAGDTTADAPAPIQP